jgi:hypothetical protein
MILASRRASTVAPSAPSQRGTLPKISASNRMVLTMSPLKRIAIVCACLITVPALAQKKQAESAPQQILPNSFANWTLTSRQTFNPKAQPTLGGPNSDQVKAAAREYGLQSGEIGTYTHAGAAGQSADTLTAVVYQMKDPSGAYGEYSYLRTPDMVPADFTDHSSIKAVEAVVLTGNLVLDVQGPNAQHNGGDLKSLVSLVVPKAEDGLLPSLPDHLPNQNRVDRSDHYILGPQTLDQFFPGAIGSSFGFNYAPEVETAHFNQSGADMTLMIADFPTPQIAQGQLDSLSKKFNVNGSQPNSGLPALYATRNQTLLVMVANAPSSEAGNKLLDQVKSGTVLTWNEPTFQFKEPSIEVMVVGAFVGTGVICLITAVSALAFGGFRLAVKRMFPNTVFDRSTQMDILQMGLVSKPIKAEDFYSYDGKKIDDRTVDKNLPDRTALRLFK